MGSKKISELTEISTDDFNPAAAYMIIEQNNVTYKMRMDTGFIASDTSATYIDSKTISIPKQTGVHSYGDSSFSFSKDNICSQASAVQIDISCVNTERGKDADKLKSQEWTPLNTRKSAQVLTKPSGSTYFNNRYDINSRVGILIGKYIGNTYNNTYPLTSEVFVEITPSEDSLSFRPYIKHNKNGLKQDWWLKHHVARYSTCMAASVTVSIAGTIRA